MNPTMFNSVEGNEISPPSPTVILYVSTKSLHLHLVNHPSSSSGWTLRSSLQSKFMNHFADMMHALCFNFAVVCDWRQLNKHLSHHHYKNYVLEADFDIPELRWDRYLVGHRVPCDSPGCFKENLI